ncbi:hypothetical protein AB0K48_30515 [Nonomuraea sp. NPDC055795]
METLRFTYRMQLAWDLRRMGVGVSVHMAFGQDMFMRVPGAANDRRISADLREDDGEWWFSWRRYRRVQAGAEDTALVVLSGVV